MKLLKSALLLLILTTISGVASSQSSRLLVEDEAHEPVAGATVSIIALPDSTLVSAAITDDDGSVSISVDDKLSALVHVSCLGFEPLDLPYNKSLQKVTLTKSTTELAEVVVKVPPASLRQMAGKFLFDPGVLKTMTANSYDLLTQTPLLDVKNGTASIFGKGASVIYINGRSPRMSAMELQQMLTSLPPDRIKRIEIITEPGSTYSADMSGGIVNIILDNPLEGFRGSTGAYLQYTRTQLSPTVSFYGDYAVDKFRISGSVYYANTNNRNKVTTQYDYTDINRIVRNTVDDRSHYNGLSGSLHLTYDFKPTSTLGVGTSVWGDSRRSKSHIDSYYNDNGAELTDYNHIDTRAPFTRPGWSIYAFYTLITDSKGSKLDVTANYSSRKSADFTDYFFEATPTHQSTEVLSHGMNFKPKFTYVFNDRFELTAGYQFVKSHIDNDYRAAADDNRFIYDDMINSLYAEWSAQWSKEISSRLGLRLENSDIRGKQLVESQSFKQNYTDLFPTLSINVRIPGPGNHSVSLNASRSLNRPFYSNLNPFVYWTSETTCSRGNPYLQPSYNWYVSCRYSFLNDFILSAGWSHSSNSRNSVNIREGDVTVSTTLNTGRFNWLYTSLTYYKTFKNVFSVRAELNYRNMRDHAWIEGIDYSVNNHGFSLSGNCGWYIPQAKFRVELHYYLSSPSNMVTRSGNWKYWLALTCTKWISNRMSIQLQFFNITGRKTDEYYQSPSYSYRQHTDLYPGFVQFSFSYSFGKQKIRGADDRNDSDLNNRFK